MIKPDPSRFFLGVNYPWVRYGQDFGRAQGSWLGVSHPDTKRIVGQDFELIRASGASVVRWFLLADGRGGFLDQDGIPTGPDDKLLADIAAALALAETNQLRICFPLIDYLWMQESQPDNATGAVTTRADTVKFAAGREALLECVLIPLFEEFRAHPALFAWEIANEPEWGILEFEAAPQAAVPLPDFRAFSLEVADAAHEYAKVPVTLGAARLLWLHAWGDLGLDLYQAHYYPLIERDQKRGLREQLAALRPAGSLDKPLWMGGLPARDPSAPDYSLVSALDACKAAGLAGACVWPWRAPEESRSEAAYGSVDPQVLSAWLTRNFSGAKAQQA